MPVLGPSFLSDPLLTCQVCSQNKCSRQTPAGLVLPLPVPHRPWSHISLDFVTGLPTLDGNTVILTVVDRFLKAAHFIPLPKLPSAKQTAELMLYHIFHLHGLPRDIVSDRGPHFTSCFWREFCRLLGASVSLSPGFQPQSNGQTERMNQEMETALRCLTSRNPFSWSKLLVWVEYAHNTLPSSATGFSPFQSSRGGISLHSSQFRRERSQSHQSRPSSAGAGAGPVHTASHL